MAFLWYGRPRDCFMSCMWLFCATGEGYRYGEGPHFLGCVEVRGGVPCGTVFSAGAGDMGVNLLVYSQHQTPCLMPYPLRHCTPQEVRPITSTHTLLSCPHSPLQIIKWPFPGSNFGQLSAIDSLLTGFVYILTVWSKCEKRQIHV